MLLIRAWIRSHLLTSAACVIMASVGVTGLRPIRVWDAAFSNSHWYVPVPQLLAYAAPATGFSNPIAIGDQTLWSLGTATNGAFTGFSSAQLAIGLDVAHREFDDPGFCHDVGADHHGVHAGRRWRADRRPRPDAADQWRGADGNADDHGPKPVDHALGLYDSLTTRPPSRRRRRNRSLRIRCRNGRGRLARAGASPVLRCSAPRRRGGS